MSKELVSIIVPIYNASKYLHKTIECIIKQSYQNIEIILLNDGSTDDSLDICNSYKEKDSRIIVVDKANSGQSDTRNKGIELATGTYLYFADSDDVLDLKLIETAVHGIQEDNDLYIFNYYHTYEKADGSIVNRKEREFQEGYYKIDSDAARLKFVTNIFLNYGCGFEVWNRLYKTEIIKKNCIKFPVFSPVIGEDACFNLFYLMNIRCLKVTNERLYYYLYRLDSSMGADRGIVRTNQYNIISRHLFDYLNTLNYRYMMKNYCLIHIKLLYHELMNVSAKDLKAELNKIEDFDFNHKRLTEAKGKLHTFIYILGLVKGMKYYLLSRYYNCIKQK